MKRNLVALAAAALLASAVATSALAAGHAGVHMGGHIGGQFGEPLIGNAPTSPIYNSSIPYTVPQSPEVGVSPASPGSLFH